MLLACSLLNALELTCRLWKRCGLQILGVRTTLVWAVFQTICANSLVPRLVAPSLGPRLSPLKVFRGESLGPRLVGPLVGPPFQPPFQARSEAFPWVVVV